MNDDARGEAPAKTGKGEVRHSHWHEHGPGDQHDHAHADRFTGGHSHTHLHVEASLGEFLAWLFGEEGAGPEVEPQTPERHAGAGDAPPVRGGNTKK